MHNAETKCTYVMSDNAAGGLKQHLTDLRLVTVHRTVGENTNSNSYSVSKTLLKQKE